jgi:hypothetical protein
MARFPLKEAEVIALSQAMVSGLTGNAALYPSPPVLPAGLTTLVSAYTTAKNAAFANCLGFCEFREKLKKEILGPR